MTLNSLKHILGCKPVSELLTENNHLAFRKCVLFRLLLSVLHLVSSYFLLMSS